MLISCPPQRDVNILLERVSCAFLCGGADGVNGAAKEAFAADNYGPRRHFRDVSVGIFSAAVVKKKSLLPRFLQTDDACGHFFISSVVGWSKEGWIRRSSHQNHCVSIPLVQSQKTVIHVRFQC